MPLRTGWLCWPTLQIWHIYTENITFVVNVFCQWLWYLKGSHMKCEPHVQMVLRQLKWSDDDDAVIHFGSVTTILTLNQRHQKPFLLPIWILLPYCYEFTLNVSLEVFFWNLMSHLFHSMLRKIHTPSVLPQNRLIAIHYPIHYLIRHTFFHENFR